jgi:hypothetical protein
VLGNEAGVTQVFSNLLGNAVKFVKPEVRPRIRVWSDRAFLPGLSGKIKKGAMVFQTFYGKCGSNNSARGFFFSHFLLANVRCSPLPCAPVASLLDHLGVQFGQLALHLGEDLGVLGGDVPVLADVAT